MMSERTFKIFVYGLTLSGESEHRLLSGASFLGEAVTMPEYALADLRVYPALVEGGDVAVSGELYEVSPKVRFELDVHHESPVLFERKAIRLEGGELGEESMVESYVMDPAKAGGKRRIWNGSWKDRFAPRPRTTSAMNPFAVRAAKMKR